jgi:hypothetical protein
MKKIYLLTDYKNQFGSFYNAPIYRGGFDLKKLIFTFKQYGYMLDVLKISSVQIRNIEWKDQLVLYTSNEEPNFYYKSYIDDIVYYLYLKKAILIPHYELLKANNNKGFMELYKNTLTDKAGYIQSYSFGCLEDVLAHRNIITFPLIFKPSVGAMSKGIKLINSWDELIKAVKKNSYPVKLINSIKETYRAFKYKGYVKNSNYQGKFVLQSFIPDLKNDWKVLIFGEKVYILKRGVRQGDFRASGSHFDYKAGRESEFPVEKLDDLIAFKDAINIPNISLDYVYDGEQGYIIEFQGIYFGMSTHDYSKDYYVKEQGEWITKPNDLDKYQLYTQSIDHYVKTNNL